MEAAVEHLRDQRAGMVVTKVCFTHNLPTGIIQMFDKYYKYTLDQCAENFLIFLLVHPTLHLISVIFQEQYAFALSAVVEEIHNILGELPSPRTGQVTPTMD